MEHSPMLTGLDIKRLSKMLPDAPAPFLNAIESAARIGATRAIAAFENEMVASVNVILKPHIHGVTAVVGRKVLQSSHNIEQTPHVAAFYTQYAQQQVCICVLDMDAARFTIEATESDCPAFDAGVEVFTGEGAKLSGGEFDTQALCGFHVVLCAPEHREQAISALKSTWSEKLSQLAATLRDNANATETLAERLSE